MGYHADKPYGWEHLIWLLADSISQLIGQFLVYPAMAKPIRRHQVGALVIQYVALIPQFYLSS